MRLTQKRYWAVEFLLLGFIILSLTGDLCKAAEDRFPTKPITLLVGFAPGGGGDISSRALAEEASKILGQPVVVVNKPGGGGAVALGELKNAKPDGYTVSLLTTGAIISPHLRKVTYDPVKDFDAILQTNTIIYGLTVRADSPNKSFKDFIAYAKANPNKVKYSTAGAGTPQHLVMLQLADMLNIQWTHVPFGGGVEAVSALLGGHVDCESGSGEWKPYVISDRLHLLATYGDKRLGSFPDVPTLVDLGYDIVAPNTQSYVAPKGMPKDRLKILHDAFHKAVETPKFREVLKQIEQELNYKNSNDTQILIKKIYDDTGKVIEKNKEAMK